MQFDQQVFYSKFTIENLNALFVTKFKGKKKSKGIDRISVQAFERKSDYYLEVITRKIVNSTYKFSQYRELLISKGRGKVPRVISIPTVRDKIALTCLKEVLFELFPDCVPKKLPSNHVRELKERSDSYSAYYRFDFKDFYPSVKHDLLLNKIRSRSNIPELVQLVENALTTPTVPLSFRRMESIRPDGGVPQGLPVSNILAEIYLRDFDEFFKAKKIHYQRYVDDVIIFCQRAELAKLVTSVKLRSSRLGLKINETKSPSSEDINREFTYLGYLFKGKHATVGTTSVDRFKLNLIDLFSKRKFGELKKERFYYQLNLKITGAKKGNKRYGWMHFYSQIDDQTLVYEIDSFIQKLLKRFEFEGTGVKSLAKAFHLIRFNKTSRYIPDFDAYSTEDMKEELRRAGVTSVDFLTEPEIIEEFNQMTDRALAQLERDVQDVY